jgi:hypothetical protein
MLLKLPPLGRRGCRDTEPNIGAGNTSSGMGLFPASERERACAVGVLLCGCIREGSTNAMPVCCATFKLDRRSRLSELSRPAPILCVPSADLSADRSRWCTAAPSVSSVLSSTPVTVASQSDETECADRDRSCDAGRVGGLSKRRDVE